MKAVLALTILVAFAAVADSSVIPSNDKSESPDVTSDSEDSVVVYTSRYDVISSPINSDFVSVPSPFRRNLSVGSIGSADRRFHTENVYRPRSTGIIEQNIIYHNFNGERVSAVRAFERVHFNQGATPVIISGGVGFTFVHIRITSARGGPIYYQVEIWGR